MVIGLEKRALAIGEPLVGKYFDSAASFLEILTRNIAQLRRELTF